MKNLCVVLAIGLSMSGLAQFARAASFTDTFDSIDPAWVPDRYDPAAFVADGGRLRIDISTADSAANRPAGFNSMFYNTQGRRRDAAVEAPWRVSGDIFLASSLNAPGSSLFRSDLWTRDSHPDEGSSNYAILSFTNQTTATGSGFRLQAFDSHVGWINLGSAGVKFGDWNTLAIEGTGDAFVFSLNGIVVHTDNTASVLGTRICVRCTSRRTTSATATTASCGTTSAPRRFPPPPRWARACWLSGCWRCAAGGAPARPERRDHHL